MECSCWRKKERVVMEDGGALEPFFYTRRLKMPPLSGDDDGDVCLPHPDLGS
jgi:hypothetical protein